MFSIKVHVPKVTPEKKERAFSGSRGQRQGFITGTEVKSNHCCDSFLFHQASTAWATPANDMELEMGWKQKQERSGFVFRVLCGRTRNESQERRPKGPAGLQAKRQKGKGKREKGKRKRGAVNG